MNQGKGYLGWVKLKKIGGQTSPGPALNTQTFIPTLITNPRNPLNFSYVPSVNAAQSPVNYVQGKRTPSVSFRALVKSSWFTNALISDLIGASTYLDTNNNNSVYSIGINMGNGNATRVFDNFSCASITFHQEAQGGSIVAEFTFVGIYGDTEKSSPATFTTPTTDNGTMLDITKSSFNSTADAVYSWRMSLMRPQAYQFEADGTRYSDAIQAGMLGGTVQYVTSDLSTTVPTSSVTIQIGSVGAGVQFVSYINPDEIVMDLGPALNSRTISYTMGDFALANFGYCVAISAM